MLQLIAQLLKYTERIRCVRFFTLGFFALPKDRFQAIENRLQRITLGVNLGSDKRIEDGGRMKMREFHTIYSYQNVIRVSDL
jgi:hypothetical protein